MTVLIRVRRRLVPLIGLLFSLSSLCERADAVLVVFDDGRHLHAESFDLKEERVTLYLSAGALLTVPLERVDRIVDDEYVRLALEEPRKDRDREPSEVSVRRQALPAAVLSMPFSPFIREASEKHRIDAALIAAVIRAESGFQPYAVSRKGARGLMQLMPATARRLGVTRPFDPRENVHGGVSYLSELARRYGEFDVDRILAAYNAGEAAVEEYDGVPPYRETQNYVRKVKKLWSEYSGIAGLAAELPAGRAAQAPGR
ncbi:MAG: Membrane-bound lytic murein transglycosylase F [Thermoanaerobaculia bacterium]|nr:Membrane-bound lytic murein transglycosylase F [Thermoanaerobaculia bacterium]